MTKRLEIIETPDYLLAVFGNPDALYNTSIQELINRGWVKGYKPLNGAPELDLPLIPEMVVGEDVDFAEMFYILLKQTYHTFDTWPEAKEYRKSKSATKSFSENDLRRAMIKARKNQQYPFSFPETDDEIIQSLKQPKIPKWFVAETEYDCCDRYQNCKSCDATAEMINLKLKTTKTNGKTYLVGKYSNE
jgi:hypothetical protein